MATPNPPTNPIPSTPSTSTSTPDEHILLDGQLLKRILHHGDESKPKPPVGSRIRAHYRGTLNDGKQFDSSYDRNEPFEFVLGQGNVIRAWDEAFKTMYIGEKAHLVCQPECAYGSAGAPPNIPPNAVLNFDVELIDYDTKEKVTEDGLVVKEVINAGEKNGTKPTQGAKINIDITIKTNNGQTIMERKNGTTILGEDTTMPYGVEKVIESMTKGEKSQFTIKNEHGNGKDKYTFENGEHKGQMITGTITLHSAENTKETYLLEADEKLQNFKHCKEVAATFFKTQHFRRAAIKYMSALAAYQHDSKYTEEQKKEVEMLKLACYSNACICRAKTGEWSKVVESANDGLKIDANNVKLLFRRGQARANLGEHEEGEQDLKRVLELDPNNNDAKRELQRIKQKLAAVREKEKKLFGGFFNRVQLVTPEEEKRMAEEAKKAASTSSISDDDSDSDMPELHDTANDADEHATTERTQNGETADAAMDDVSSAPQSVSA